MKKLCILQNGMSWGGTDTFVLNLCRQLNNKDYEITVVNPCLDEIHNQREQDFLATGIQIIHTYPVTSLKGQFMHFYKLYKILKEGKFDVFHTNIDLFNGPNLLIARLAGVPLRVCHSHNSNQGLGISNPKSLKLRLYRKVMRWLCWNFSNRRCGCSIEANDFLFKGKDWRNEKYPTIINNPVDIERFSTPIDKEIEKKKLGLSSKKHLITIGRFITQKNPIFLVKVLHNLFEQRADIDMIWIGSGGDMESEVKRMADEYGIGNRIFFMGGRKDVDKVLKCSDLFILPSAFEGLGIVLIEAQAAGLPCIASDVIPEATQCGGVKYLSLDNDIQLWVDSICDILDNKSTILQINQDSLNQFSSENSSKQIEAVFCS